MPRKSRQELNLKMYMKEETIAITFRLPRSQHDLLTTMAALTHQALPDLVASLLANRVMADVEQLVRDSQTLRDDATPSPIPPQSRPSVPAGTIEAHGQRPVESVSATNRPQPETPHTPHPTPAVPVNSARPPQASPNPSTVATAPNQPPLPPRPPAQPLPPTPPRPETPPIAKTPSGDAEFPPKPETRHE